MNKLPAVLACVAVTFLCWGTYGVVLHEGQDLMGKSALRPFVGVGIAYFMIAVVVPVLLLTRSPEKGNWSFRGTMMALFAGAVGALGALGVILALNYGGKPLYVMPLVFGGAPVVNTLVTLGLSKTQKQISPLFIVGLMAVVAGSAGVLVTKPRPEAVQNAVAEAATNFPLVVMSIITAAVCWGAYGPLLHLGQARMGGSRLRPFCCVGISYFVIAVALPLILLSTSPDKGHWDFTGMIWSIGAGAAGAIGALGIIFAFNFGGKPVYVMPLVFGFAPVVNTLCTMWVNSSFGKIQPLFIVSMLVVIAGAVVVLIFQPKDAKPAAALPVPSTSPNAEAVPSASNAN